MDDRTMKVEHACMKAFGPQINDKRPPASSAEVGEPQVKGTTPTAEVNAQRDAGQKGS